MTERRTAPPEGRRVTIEITEIQGTGACSIGHAVGDRWEVGSALVPAGICGWAYAAMLPFLQPLRFGGSFPWEAEGEALVCCPDPANPVVFRLRVAD
ncbi:MAG TPA: TIGR04076 family protein [Actinobacteria bacterium]|nr:TIGR04076 family protein [Actinomycetota bacterium]